MDFVDLVISVHEALLDAQVSHAFGGALAYGYVATPRGTVDIDVNAFIPATEIVRVDTAMATIGFQRDPDLPLPIAGVRFSSDASLFPVDVFPSIDERYEAVERRVIQCPFGRETAILPFLSAEDLCVFKLSFGRPKDWFDLTAIAAAQPNLDMDYVEDQLIGLRGPTMYPRLARFRRLLPLR